MNLKIAELLDQEAELERIRSIDEFQMRLPAGHESIEQSFALVAKMKRRVYSEIGDSLRFSAGVGPNPFLAKLAGKLMKPDGCRYLLPEILPNAISHLKLDDLPGIAAGTVAKLHNAGITSIEQLYGLDPKEARIIWGSIEGERFIRALHGKTVALPDTQRGGYGSSKILSPEFRKIPEAYLVGRWLVEKAASRLRGDGRVASQFSLSMGFIGGGGWARGLNCEATQATHDFLDHHRSLWRLAWPTIRAQRPVSVSINLGKVAMLRDRTGDLLRPLGPGELSKSERVSAALDQINMRFGADTISVGVNRPHYGFFDRG